MAAALHPRALARHGFTLIELVVVVVLVGVLAAGTAHFLIQSTRAYLYGAGRAKLASVGHIAVERLSRELRNALPNSVRTTPGGTCIEFLPVVASANYQDRRLTYATGTASLPLPVVGGAPPAARFDALELSFTPRPGTNYYIAVYPLTTGSGNANPYSGTDPGTLFAYAGQSTAGLPTGITRLRLKAVHQYARPAPFRRMYVVREPVSFCVSGTHLDRYTGYGLRATQPTPASPGMGALAQRVANDIQLSDNGTAVRPFTYTPGTLQRTAVIELDLRFMRQVSGGAEWARLHQEVQIRNVP